MALEEKKIPYEVLLRFNTEGLFVGAHVQHLERIIYDGRVLSERVLPAESLTTDNFPTSEIMSETLKAAVLTHTGLTATLAASQVVIDSQDEKIGQLESQLAFANESIESKRATIATQANRIQELEAQAASVTEALDAPT